MASSEHNSTNYSLSESSESEDDSMTLKDIKMAVCACAATNKDSKDGDGRPD